MAKRPAETGRNPGGGVQLTWDKFQAICKTLEDCGAKYKACEAHGFRYSTVTQAIASQLQIGDAEWQELWNESMDKFRESLEEEAKSRARDGWSEPVFHQGKVAGYIQRKSDRLLEVMLRAHMPERFRDNVHHTGEVTPSGGLDVFSQLSLDAKKRIRQIIMEDMEQQRLNAANKQAVTVVPDQPQLEGPAA